MHQNHSAFLHIREASELRENWPAIESTIKSKNAPGARSCQINFAPGQTTKRSSSLRRSSADFIEVTHAGFPQEEFWSAIGRAEAKAIAVVVAHVAADLFAAGEHDNDHGARIH